MLHIFTYLLVILQSSMRADGYGKSQSCALHRDYPERADFCKARINQYIWCIVSKKNRWQPSSPRESREELCNVNFHQELTDPCLLTDPLARRILFNRENLVVACRAADDEYHVAKFILVCSWPTSKPEPSKSIQPSNSSIAKLRQIR